MVFLTDRLASVVVLLCHGLRHRSHRHQSTYGVRVADQLCTSARETLLCNHNKSYHLDVDTQNCCYFKRSLLASTTALRADDATPFSAL